MVDYQKLDRVRALLEEHELDAIVVRAPDNVVYLTNFWGMKGYDACVFPREGEPVLLCLEASAEDADRTAWTKDVRLLRGYHPSDRGRRRRGRWTWRSRPPASTGGSGSSARSAPGLRPDGGRADHVHVRLVRGVAGRGTTRRPSSSLHVQ